MAPADVLGGSKPGQVRHISESKSRAIVTAARQLWLPPRHRRPSPTIARNAPCRPGQSQWQGHEKHAPMGCCNLTFGECACHGAACASYPRIREHPTCLIPESAAWRPDLLPIEGTRNPRRADRSLPASLCRTVPLAGQVRPGWLARPDLATAAPLRRPGSQELPLLRGHPPAPPWYSVPTTAWQDAGAL